MVDKKSKKPKWQSTTVFDGDLSISQFIYARDVAKFAKDNKKNMVCSLEKLHAYVFPYIVNEGKKQSKDIVSITIRELIYESC